MSDSVGGHTYIAVWTLRDSKLVSIAGARVQYILVIWHLFIIIVTESAREIYFWLMNAAVHKWVSQTPTGYIKTPVSIKS